MVINRRGYLRLLAGVVLSGCGFVPVGVVVGRRGFIAMLRHVSGQGETLRELRDLRESMATCYGPHGR